MRDIVEQLRIEISEDRLGHPIDVMKQAADEIERLRKQLSRQEWYDSADRHLMQEEIDQLRKDVQNLNRDCMMFTAEIERLRNLLLKIEMMANFEIGGNDVCGIRTQRHRRLDDAGVE